MKQFSALAAALLTSVLVAGAANTPLRSVDTPANDEQITNVEVSPALSDNDDQIYTQVEQEPEYSGGLSALMTAISQNLNYPATAVENGVQGRVIVKFVVEKDGTITNPKVVKGVDHALDREAVKVVSKLGKMSSPAMINGRPVRSYYTVPVVFKLSR